MARPASDNGERIGLACRMLGHRMRFQAEGETMRWHCERGCGTTGEKTYGSTADATRYARALDREDRDDLGKRSPISLFVLRLARRRRAQT
jgi:hypothetical protein